MGSKSHCVISFRPNDACVHQYQTKQHWFRQWLVAWPAPSHYLNQFWLIVNWTLRNKLPWNSNQNTKVFIHKNAFECVVCEKAAILYNGIWLNILWSQFSYSSSPSGQSLWPLQTQWLSMQMPWAVQLNSSSSHSGWKQKDNQLKNPILTIHLLGKYENIFTAWTTLIWGRLLKSVFVKDTHFTFRSSKLQQHVRISLTAILKFVWHITTVNFSIANFVLRYTVVTMWVWTHEGEQWVTACKQTQISNDCLEEHPRAYLKEKVWEFNNTW